MFHPRLSLKRLHRSDGILSRTNDDTTRSFLLLQGPHGPFFDRLGRILRAAGADVWRCGFNAGDEFFWTDKARFIAHTGSLEEWPDHLEAILAEKDITDIILYGDVRPIHSTAIRIASEHGLRIHVFEEGYLRPFWISYERGGANGNSLLMRISLDQMRAAQRKLQNEVKRPPAHWGDMHQHKFYGAFYHFLILTANRAYVHYRSHRAISVLQEFRLNLRRLLLTPLNNLAITLQWHRIRQSGRPYSLVLMQLQHDSNFLGHSPFRSNAEFIEMLVAEFARSAPSHHHLIFKAHPLEDGRARNRTTIRRTAARYEIPDRVHYLRGGKLAALLSQAKSIVTVNSTAAQQALWRNLPVKTLGQAIYNKPGIVSDQSLAEFFRNPTPPDPKAYQTLRDYLLQTSQIPGGFYSVKSRGPALRVVSDMILAKDDPYQSLETGNVPYRQQLADFEVFG